MSYEPIHQKYRPQTFSELVGQEAIATTLSNAITKGKIAHAYLFTGPRGTGKTSSARILAKSLNCLETKKPTPHPCGKCEACRGISRGSALDVIEIDAASNTGVDNIREIIERSQFAPVQCRYKVYVIDECHMLSTAAFNALLKTLEEPPPAVIFVLATTDPQRVLPTIISRCQRFDYRRIPLVSMVEHLAKIAKLEEININTESLTLVAQIANGGLRDAQSLLDQLSLLEGEITTDMVWNLVGATPEQDLITLLEAIAAQQPVEILAQCRNILNRGKEPLIILQNLASFYVNLLIAKTAPQQTELVTVTPQTWKRLTDLAQLWEVTDILKGEKYLKDSEVQIKNTTQPHLWLELTLLGLIPTEINKSQTSLSGTSLKLPTSTTTPTTNQAEKIDSKTSLKLPTSTTTPTTNQAEKIDSKTSLKSPTSTTTPTTNQAEKIDSIYIDGSCLGNPGPGGWAYVVYSSQKAIQETGGYEPDTTNQRMELSAAIAALDYLDEIDYTSPITIYTDSQYVIKGITQWIQGWKKKGWQNSKKEPVANKDLWIRLDLLNSELNVTWKHVYGHQGNEGNERADTLARSYASRTNQSQEEPPPAKLAETITTETISLPEIWQKVLDTVKSLTTRTLLNQQGVLLSFDGSVARVGVSSEKMIKLHQTKVPEIEAAFANVFGTPIKVNLEVSNFPKEKKNSLASTSTPPPNPSPEPNIEVKSTPPSSLNQGQPKIVSSIKEVETIVTEVNSPNLVNTVENIENIDTLEMDKKLQAAAETIANFFQGEILDD